MVRLKTRYLVVEAHTAPVSRRPSLQKDDIASVMRDSIARSYGDFGVGVLQYAFQVLYYDQSTNLAVVRCAREQTKLVETSLTFVTDIQGQEVRFRIVRVCGCSRTCREQLLKLSLEKMRELKPSPEPEWLSSTQAAIAAIDAQ